MREAWEEGGEKARRSVAWTLMVFLMPMSMLLSHVLVFCVLWMVDSGFWMVDGEEPIFCAWGLGDLELRRGWEDGEMGGWEEGRKRVCSGFGGVWDWEWRIEGLGFREGRGVLLLAKMDDLNNREWVEDGSMDGWIDMCVCVYICISNIS